MHTEGYPDDTGYRYSIDPEIKASNAHGEPMAPRHGPVALPGVR